MVWSSTFRSFWHSLFWHSMWNIKHQTVWHWDNFDIRLMNVEHQTVWCSTFISFWHSTFKCRSSNSLTFNIQMFDVWHSYHFDFRHSNVEHLKQLDLQHLNVEHQTVWHSKFRSYCHLYANIKQFHIQHLNVKYQIVSCSTFVSYWHLIFEWQWLNSLTLDIRMLNIKQFYIRHSDHFGIHHLNVEHQTVWRSTFVSFWHSTFECNSLTFNIGILNIK